MIFCNHINIVGVLSAAALMTLCGYASASNGRTDSAVHQSPVMAIKAGESGYKVGTAPPAEIKRLVDLNQASKAELMTLRGVGEVEAGKIINGRPYTSKADIVSRAHIPTGIYQMIKLQIMVKP